LIDQHEALQRVRQEQTPLTFWKTYATRCGNEATLSRAVCKYELRTARYSGLAKTNVQKAATVATINIHHIFDWWQHRTPAPTTTSAFAKPTPSSSLLGPLWDPISA
jgi:hypothetical protein